jgi:hypothetical protein
MSERESPDIVQNVGALAIIRNQKAGGTWVLEILASLAAEAAL